MPEPLELNEVLQGRKVPSVEPGTTAGWMVINLNSFRGDTQNALHWLDLAYATGARDHRALAPDPFFEKLRAYSNFKEIIHRMENDVARMRQRAQKNSFPRSLPRPIRGRLLNLTIYGGTNDSRYARDPGCEAQPGG
jgi:hypothetical protein